MKDLARLNKLPFSFTFSSSRPIVRGRGGTTSEDLTLKSFVLRLKRPARDDFDFVANPFLYTPPFVGAAAPGGRVGPGASGVVGELVELAEDEGDGGLRVGFVVGGGGAELGGTMGVSTARMDSWELERGRSIVVGRGLGARLGRSSTRIPKLSRGEEGEGEGV